jgi:hypothetical protein
MALLYIYSCASKAYSFPPATIWRKGGELKPENVQAFGNAVSDWHAK